MILWGSGGRCEGARLAVICAPSDSWFPDEQWRELQQRLPTLEVPAWLPPYI